MNIVFENNHVLVVNKPAGLVVNRSATTPEETLQDELSQYFRLAKDDLGIGQRAGIVHRLDRETSGLMVVAKTKKAFDFLTNEFKERKVKKEYLCLVHGLVGQESGTVRTAVGRIGKFGKFGVTEQGREAQTEYKKISNFQFPVFALEKLVFENGLNKVRLRYLQKQASYYTLVSVYPKTGRTHQIRVHLKSIGHPVVSDLIYGPRKLLKFDLMWCPRLFLHAAALSFRDPQSKKVLKFASDLPNDLKNAILTLDKF